MDKYIGRKLDGRYQIQEIIGMGGMSVVYKAYDSIEDRTVAVKILKEEFLSNEEFRRRFKNESKAVAVLSHPNIVKVFDVGFGDKLQYIVMEYIDGITLKEYIDQQKVLTWKEAVHFTTQILKALQHAHEKGIVHRDIKPQNIMLLSDGTIKVTDFGIARFAHSETKTMTDKAIGSVHYISPEQARGDVTDEKTDIYSVGVMLYEMLTGKLPFEADSAVSVAIMQMQADAKKPRELNSTIPEGLEDITLRAMRKDPEQRYQSAAEMLKDIEKFKLNPSIHFEYKYFIDDTPTKYVDSIKKIRGAEGQADKKKKKNASYIPILSGVAAGVLLVTLIFVIGFLAFKGYIPGFGTTSATITAPDLVGQDYNSIITNSAYTSKYTITKIAEQNSDTVPEGEIISQDPQAGETMKTGGTIEVTISLGPKTAEIPDVYNKSKSDAENMLQSSGFDLNNVNVVSQYNDQIADGYVISTDPARGETVAVTTTITVYVSKGPEESLTTVPSVVGDTLSDAKAKITDAGLVVGNITYDTTSTKAAGTVISQSLDANSSVSEGETVDLTVSKGTADANTSGKAVSFEITLPESSAQYIINVSVNGNILNIENKFPTGSFGDIKVTIPANTDGCTGTLPVSIYVQGGDSGFKNKIYQSYTVDFDTGEKTLTKNNSDSFNTLS